MGCQNICEKAPDDKNLSIEGKNEKRNNMAMSRNAFKNNNLSDKLQSETTYKCSMNIHETIVEKDMLRFTIKASNVHKMIPIWVDKGAKVSFKVANEWGFEESNETFNSAGCFNFEDKPNNMPFGCLAAYIGNGPYFTVTNNLVGISDHEGPLYMFQNNGLYSVTPKGSLEVEVQGVKPMSVYQIEKKYGWNLELLDTSISEMKEDEINLLILMNKVRTNPKKFAYLYLTNENKSQAELELFEALNTMEPIGCLNTSQNLYEISLNHAKDIGKFKLAGHESSDGSNMEQRLKENGISTKSFAENCIFGYNDPMEIILKLLIDEDNENRNQRKIILNPEFNYVGIAIEPHSGEFCWSCIQDFIYLSSSFE